MVEYFPSKQRALDLIIPNLGNLLNIFLFPSFLSLSLLLFCSMKELNPGLKHNNQAHRHIDNPTSIK